MDADATPIVLVSGPPASGKTFIARAVAAHLSLPLIEKDVIKEVLFDTLGVGDVEWSRRLGRAAFALLYEALETQLRAGKPVVAEANFTAAARETLRGIHDRSPFRALELHCTAAADTLLARYLARAPTRHAGHVDEQRAGDLAAALSDNRHVPLRLGGECLVIRTERFDDIPLGEIMEAARRQVRLY